jgi:hypothetical protein
MPELRLLILIIITALANSQVIDTWINGSIFRKPRQFIRLLGKKRRRKSKNRSWVLRAASELLLCPLCLSHWTAAVLLGGAHWAWDFQVRAPAWVILWLAVVGLSRLVYQSANKEEGDPLAGIKPYEPPA